MLDANDPTVKAAVLGRQVEDFLQSDIGKYLVGRADSDAQEALDQLKRVAWWRGKRIQYLQNRVYVAEKFQEWLGNAYSEGLNALRSLENV